jgi:hypothetical protein
MVGLIDESENEESFSNRLQNQNILKQKMQLN